MTAETTDIAPLSPQVLWNQASAWWAEHLKNDKNRFREVFPVVLGMLGSVSGKRILDAGCGEGTFSRILATAGGDVTGIDFADLIEEGISEERRNALRIHYYRLNIADLYPIGLPGFDVIVCNLVLHCCPDVDRIMSVFQRLLKPGGQLVISDLHPETFKLYSRHWTKCANVRDNEYRYTLSEDCPELVLYLHSREVLRSAFQRNGFICQTELAPPSRPSEHLPPGLPRFHYFRLQKR